MSKGKQHEASASAALVGTGRWSARRKVSVVLPLAYAPARTLSQSSAQEHSRGPGYV